jgi:2,3-bisphosphoglycerate-dependent phosphoglycerate mutase
MKKAVYCWLVFSLIIGGSCEEQAGDLTTFILVRHAEKADDGTNDPDLTREGEGRALKLAFMLKDTEIDAVYSTDYRRTKNTAKPLAEMQDLDVQQYEPNKPEEILRIIDQHKGKTVLMVGHSNTIPWTANLLLGKKVYDDFKESEYGIMLIVSVGKTNKGGKGMRMNY